MPNRFREASL